MSMDVRAPIGVCFQVLDPEARCWLRRTYRYMRHRNVKRHVARDIIHEHAACWAPWSDEAVRVGSISGTAWNAARAEGQPA